MSTMYKRRDGSEYCLSHQKNLPHGRIDDDSYVPKKKKVNEVVEEKIMILKTMLIIFQ